MRPEDGDGGIVPVWCMGVKKLQLKPIDKDKVDESNVVHVSLLPQVEQG
ncbi:hypothetical protein JI435_040900 [Parastagonospora nodorum SN15]|uniref:Uncharacterized protein n=1 Tax=Phaeosphaeria nodorum (strain SN15 / ATCC MYA-4574 / FGSC 10173) TaxID=321614 RepID=A0A7U2F7P8_PHANO|nr:hypothetical protein JI435_040900 [Parastagonospora nodorum SN15]